MAVIEAAAPPRKAPRRRGAIRKRWAETALRYVVIVAACVIILFPIYCMLLTTFQPQQYTLTWPPPLFLKGFNLTVISSVFKEQPIAEWLLHSATASGITVAITILLAVPGAYLLSWLRWRGVGAFGFLLLFTQMMPGVMIIVPELQLFRTLMWTNNLYALGIVYAAFNVPLGCWILKSSFEAVPGEVVDASLVDGCGPMGTLFRILLPLSRPGLVAVAIVAFFGSWNDYAFAAAFLTNRALYTAGEGIATFISEQDIALYQLIGAGAVFAVIPIVLYLAVQRHVVRGLTAGAVKG